MSILRYKKTKLNDVVERAREAFQFQYGAPCMYNIVSKFSNIMRKKARCVAWSHRHCFMSRSQAFSSSYCLERTRGGCYCNPRLMVEIQRMRIATSMSSNSTEASVSISVLRVIDEILQDQVGHYDIPSNVSH